MYPRLSNSIWRVQFSFKLHSVLQLMGKHSQRLAYEAPLTPHLSEIDQWQQWPKSPPPPIYGTAGTVIGILCFFSSHLSQLLNCPKSHQGCHCWARDFGSPVSEVNSSGSGSSSLSVLPLSSLGQLHVVASFPIWLAVLHLLLGAVTKQFYPGLPVPCLPPRAPVPSSVWFFYFWQRPSPGQRGAPTRESPHHIRGILFQHQEVSGHLPAGADQSPLPLPTKWRRPHAPGCPKSL